MKKGIHNKIKRLKKNNNFLHIGYKLQILEFVYGQKYIANVEIIEIQDKGLYNMYVCKNIKTGCKITFTDMDIGCKQRVKNNKKLIIEVRYDEGEIL